MAESVAENSEEEAGERGGETIWLSVCLGSQFAKLNLQKSRRRTKVGLPGKKSLASPVIKLKHVNNCKEKKIQEQTPKTTWMRPRLSVSLELRFP